MSYNLELLTTENQAQWANVLNITPNIQKKEIKPYIKLALKEIEGERDSRIMNLANLENFSAVRTVLCHFTRLRSACKGPWVPDDVNNFLESIGFSPDCIEEFVQILCAEQLYANIKTTLCFKPTLLALSWKIDLSMSQRALKEENIEDTRVEDVLYKNTSVILSLGLSDGSTKNYRLSIMKFSELRYQISVILKNMIVLEKRKSMRVL